MGDEEIGEAELALQVAQQVDDLRADRDVERADRLVEDEEARAQGEGARDVDALALATAELVRIARQGGWVEADRVEQFAEARGQAFRRRLAVDSEGLGENLLDASCAG